MFEEGRGIEKDYEKAMYWYKKAANQGYKKAEIEIKRIKANKNHWW